MSGTMSVFDIAGRAMSAQIIRLNTVASNMANASSVASSKEGAYRALKPVFTEVTDGAGISTVKVDQVVQSNTDPTKRHDPSNPLADKNGDVWDAGVDSAAELVDMIETQRQYQNNVQVMQTAKTLTLDTLRIEK
jgi:flagellar basal-body rod protein FlgC